MVFAVHAPTGAGKTLVAASVICHLIKYFEKHEKVLGRPTFHKHHPANRALQLFPDRQETNRTRLSGLPLKPFVV